MSYKAEDIKIRVIKWLIEGNLSFNAEKDSIGTEVLFSNNKRKADLLVLSKELHALEIKGDYDNLKKLKNQLNDYHKTFDRVSVVVALKHLSKIYRIIKPYTGLIVFDKESLSIARCAKLQKRLNKRSLLAFLSKPELNRLLKVDNNKQLSTDELRHIIAKKLTLREIQNRVHLILKKRYGELFRLFLKDTCGNITSDYLRGLCGKVEKLHT
jgi:hypothetical protein